MYSRHLHAAVCSKLCSLTQIPDVERFREVLHGAVQSALRDGADEVQKNGAIQTREGWMHIHGTSPFSSVKDSMRAFVLPYSF